MTVKSDTLRKLAKLNLTGEQLAGVLDILADQVEADEMRKNAQAERKRKQRQEKQDQDNSGNVTGQSRDSHGTVTVLSQSTPLVPPFPDKESPPTPPKEINPYPPISPHASPSASARFGEFWEIYPHKVGKAAAQAAFAKASKRIDFDSLMAGLRRYVAKTDDRPWCNPATWLNQGRWDDAPASVQPIKRGQAPPRPMTDLERIFYATLDPTDDRPNDFERNLTDVPRLPGS